MATQGAATQRPTQGAKPQGTPAQEKSAEPVLTFEQFINQRKPHLAAVAEGMVDPDKIVKLAMMARSKNEYLRNCSFESIWLSLLSLAEAGLEPDGVEAALVPYNGECQGQPMYRGICKLLYSSGMVKDVYADVFYTNEIDQGHYRFRKGSKPYVHHEPLLKDRGEVAGAYAVIHTINGGVLADQMSVEDIERIRKFSKATYKGNPWEAHWNEQAKKTVLKRCSKTGPQSKQLRAVARAEGEEIEAELLSTEELPRGTAGVRAAVQRQLQQPVPQERIETPTEKETVSAQRRSPSPEQEEPPLAGEEEPPEDSERIDPTAPAGAAKK